MQIEELYQYFLKSSGVSTDTRNISPNSIFFALKGANFNGNTFSRKALESGATMAIVDETPDQPDERIVLVKDVLKTLQQLASYHRKKVSATIIGLTGSNGKTTTKELMAAVLRKKFRVHATAGNLNNHIGVPLTLLSMPSGTEIAIIEMGANQPDDIKELCEIAAPDCGLITNIGNAHLQGFGNREGVIRAKSQLFDHLRKKDGLVFVNSSDPTIAALSEGMKSFRYSSGSEPGDITGKLCGRDLKISFEWKHDDFNSGEIQTQMTGGYNLPNLLAAVSAGKYFGVEKHLISEALREYEPRNNRSQIKETEKNILILDAYNANPSSVAAALNDFARIHSTKKYIVLGDMLELGTESSRAHAEILDLIQQLALTGIVVGPEFKKATENLSTAVIAFESTDAAARFLQKETLSGLHILIKGSRSMQLEKLVPEL